MVSIKQEIGSYIRSMNALNYSQNAIVAGFVRLLEFHDMGVKGHSDRVAVLVAKLARELENSSEIRF